MQKKVKTVVQPAATRLTTVVAVQAELNLPDGEGIERIASLIDQASSAICDYCARQFAQATISETIYTAYGWVNSYRENFLPTTVILTRLPIVSIVKITESMPLTTAFFNYDEESGVLELPHGTINAEIVYVGGYLLPGQDGRTLPAAVERACIDTVSNFWYKAKRSDPLIKRDMVQGIGQTDYYDPTLAGLTGILPSTAQDALATYRLV